MTHLDVSTSGHPAFGGGDHRLELDTFDRAGRRGIVGTCSCLGWHASILVLPDKAGRAEARQTAELREAHGDHVVAAEVPTVIAVPAGWLT